MRKNFPHRNARYTCTGIAFKETRQPSSPLSLTSLTFWSSWWTTKKIILRPWDKNLPSVVVLSRNEGLVWWSYKSWGSYWRTTLHRRQSNYNLPRKKWHNNVNNRLHFCVRNKNEKINGFRFPCLNCLSRRLTCIRNWKRILTPKLLVGLKLNWLSSLWLPASWKSISRWMMLCSKRPIFKSLDQPWALWFAGNLIHIQKFPQCLIECILLCKQ